MTTRPYDPELKAQIAAALTATEAHEEAARERREAIEEIKREIARFLSVGISQSHGA